MDQNDPTASLIRSLTAALGMVYATKGFIDQATATTLAGATVAILMALWGWYSKRKIAIIASAATRLDPSPLSPERIVTDPATANAIPSNKVVAH